MTLPASPPRYTGTPNQIWVAQQKPIVRGEKGWRTWALQRDLQVRGFDIVPDGDFGPKTEKKVKLFQGNNDIEVVGYAGPHTQARLLALIAATVSVPGLPADLAQGFNDAEGAHMVAPVNWYTPAGGKPGCDCGPVQWRQLGPPFDSNALKRAFDARESFMWALRVIAARVEEYSAINPRLSDEMLLRLAVFAHNWPVGASYYARNGRLPNPNGLATWTSKPGGGHYTQAEWLRVYPDKILG